MADYTIYALKVDSKHSEFVYNSLLSGEGRFGWSYVETGDLNLLKERIEQNGWNSLDEEEKECYQNFLLDFKKGDFVVYINTPSLGKCTIACITGGYYWKWENDDFNHRFSIDPGSISVFDRNDAIVHPALRARLKLRGRWWRIYLKEEFEKLLEALKQGKTGAQYTTETNFKYLAEAIKQFMPEITKKIHHTHPNFSLGRLIAEVMENIPNVNKVNFNDGAGDCGADIVVIYEEGFPIPGMLQQKTCVVQVKSYEGQHWSTRAVEDIERAFAHYPNADMGLIVSTASESTELFENAVDSLSNKINKPIGILIGADVATFVLKYGANLIFK